MWCKIAERIPRKRQATNGQETHWSNGQKRWWYATRYRKQREIKLVDVGEGKSVERPDSMKMEKKP